jgi:hypothetical protein
MRKPNCYPGLLDYFTLMRYIQKMKRAFTVTTGMRVLVLRMEAWPSPPVRERAAGAPEYIGEYSENSGG